MLIALSGVTGVGKTYFSNIISKKLGIKKVNTIRTRKRREKEKGIFLTSEELDKLIEQGEIAYDFSVFGSRYAYLKNEVYSNDFYLFEMHYTTLKDFKEKCKDIVSIYILPDDLNKSINALKKRNLSKDKEKERIEEIKEQYNIMKKEAYNLFDYVIINDYTKESEKKMVDLIKDIIKSFKN